MNDPIALARERSLPRLRRMLLRGWPRLAVSAMLALTTLAGFLCSVALLHLGVRGMGLRYALAVLFAYAVFLAQLRIWVARARRGWASGVHAPRASADLPDISGDVQLSAPRVEGSWGGGGGRFAGGGASGSFDAPAARAFVAAGGPGPAPSSAGSGGGGIDIDLDLGGDDSGAILAIIAIVAMVTSGLLAAGFIIYSAPTLLAEVFFDGVVSGVLYRRLRRGAAREWWQGALARTWIPATVVLVVFCAGGLVLERAMPGAHTVGEVLHRLLA